MRDQNALMAWASQILGYDAVAPNRLALAAVHDGQIVGAAIFHDFNWPDIQVTMASTSPRWATRANFRELLRYPFVHCRCKRLTAITGATNQRARAFLCRFGFRQEGIHPDALPSGDAISYGLLARDAARWLAEDRYGQAVGSISA